MITITFSDTSYIDMRREDKNFISSDWNGVTTEQLRIAMELYLLTEKQNETNSRTT